jgi:LysM repeat protein
MENLRHNWQQYGGHIILALVALFLVGGGLLSQSDRVVQEGGARTAVSLLPTATLAPLPTSVLPTTEANDLRLLSPLPVVADSGLSPAANPRTYQAKKPEHNFTTYTVKPGDTPNIIADSLSISPATLLGGNPWMSQESNALQTGAELLVLPVDGALHTVKPGDTLESIAAQYNVPVEDIVNYAPNNLEFTERLFPDTQLLIPGVEIGSFYWTAPKAPPNSNNGQWAVVGTGSFSWPVGGRCATTFYWYGHPGLDISLRVGAAVSAADTGTVTYASWASGSFYDYGNLIVINHGNGYETFYAHLSAINVVPGQIVEKGQLIGASGNSGRSSGPHIHIEIRLNDARLDPLSYLGGSAQDCTGG